MTDKIAKRTDLPHLNTRLVQLTDSNGFCYVDINRIEGISGPMFLKRNPESRKLCLSSGYVLYCANTPLNCEKLGIPFDTMERQRGPVRPSDLSDEEAAALVVLEAAKERRAKSANTRKPPYFRRAPKASE